MTNPAALDYDYRFTLFGVVVNTARLARSGRPVVGITNGDLIIRIGSRFVILTWDRG